jgi:translation initiation factor 2 subunit 1
MEKLPEKDELVIATIRKIFPYGAFCTLDEYGDREAFVHISEVASRWVKNIHEFLKENQKVVARVYHFLPEKNQIDLSIRRVSEAEKKLKLESVKREKRAHSLLSVLAKRLKKDPAKFSSEMTELFTKEFGGVMEAFEKVSAEPDALKGLEIPKETVDAIIDIASQNIKKPHVEVSRTLNVACTQPNGIDVIKKTLAEIEAIGGGGDSISISYLGAPNYKLRVIADDYKAAEKMLTAIVKKGTEEMKKHHGTMEISGEEK